MTDLTRPLGRRGQFSRLALAAPTAQAAKANVYDRLVERTTGPQKLQALAAVCDQFERDFGRWPGLWCESNRFMERSDSYPPVERQSYRLTPDTE